MPVVLFSGGCDSTLVLYNRAMQALKGGTRITALSINHEQVGAQIEQQVAREGIKTEFAKRQLPIDYIEVFIKQSGSGVVCDGGLSQPVIWLSMAAMYTAETDTLYAGYHGGDDYWHLRQFAEAAFNNLCTTLNKKVTIEYPLEFMQKRDVIQELINIGLYKLCWFCENPLSLHTVCGDCTPCRTHKDALLALLHDKEHLRDIMDITNEPIKAENTTPDDYTVYPAQPDDITIAPKIVKSKTLDFLEPAESTSTELKSAVCSNCGNTPKPTELSNDKFVHLGPVSAIRHGMAGRR